MNETANISNTSPPGDGHSGFASWARLASEFLFPSHPWTSLRFVEWDESGAERFSFSSGEREYREREERPREPVSGVTCSHPTLGKLRAEVEEADSGDLLSRIDQAPEGRNFLLEVGSPSSSDLSQLEPLLASFLPSEIASGIAEFGFKERLVRARSDNHLLPFSLESAGVTCLDARVPTVKSRYGDYSQGVVVCQRWLRMFFSEDWLVGLWGPPVISEPPNPQSNGLRRSGGWHSVLSDDYPPLRSDIRAFFPPRRERWRQQGNLDLPPPEGTGGPTLAIRYLQDIAAATGKALDDAIGEIALSEHQLFTETMKDESWIACDFDKVQVDLMILGGFLFDLSEDLAMLEARVTGEPSLAHTACGALRLKVKQLGEGLQRPRTDLREALNTLAALKTTRRINVEDEAGRRNRRLEVLIAIVASITLIPGLIFAGFQLSEDNWFIAVLVSVALSVFVVMLILRGLRGDLPPGFDRDGQVWDPHRERLKNARQRIQGVTWDEEWPSKRGSR